MIWILRIILFLIALITGIVSKEVRKSESATKRQTALVRAFFAFSVAIFLESFLPWDLAWWVDIFYVTAAISAGVKIALDVKYN